MFRLRTGYLISGIATGLVLLFSFFWTLPDGKLHIVFCDVGQGDAAYVRFPDGRDMLVDGGPNDKVLGCLGRHMPFWDRHINLVLMTHPQKDHMQGLIAVVSRFNVDYFVRSDVDNTTEGYRQLVDVIKRRTLNEKFVTAGESVRVGTAALSILWPSMEQIAVFKRHSLAVSQESVLRSSVLGATTPSNLNDGSVVFWLRYGSFDALFTGDADVRVEGNYIDTQLANDTVEVLKVPHHGSKTGMTDAFLDWLDPKLAVISVGNNSYGHPAEDTLAKLASRGIPVRRTDQDRDIEIISDGMTWDVKQSRQFKDSP